MRTLFNGELVEVTGFHADVKNTPKRKGVYQTKLVYCSGSLDDEILFSYWDGTLWMDSCATAKEAKAAKFIGAARKHWRGLVVNPKAVK